MIFGYSKLQKMYSNVIWILLKTNHKQRKAHYPPMPLENAVSEAEDSKKGVRDFTVNIAKN